MNIKPSKLNDNTPIKWAKSATTISIDIAFEKDGKRYHLVNRDFEPDFEGENVLVYYNYLYFRVDKADMSNIEITSAIVNYLAGLKMYLHNYSVISDRTFVSYATDEEATTGDEGFHGLTYTPRFTERNVTVKAEVQLEDGVDYKDYLGIKIDGINTEMAADEVYKIYPEMSDEGMETFAILDDEEYEMVM